MRSLLPGETLAAGTFFSSGYRYRLSSLRPRPQFGEKRRSVKQKYCFVCVSRQTEEEEAKERKMERTLLSRLYEIFSRALVLARGSARVSLNFRISESRNCRALNSHTSHFNITTLSRCALFVSLAIRTASKFGGVSCVCGLHNIRALCTSCGLSYVVTFGVGIGNTLKEGERLGAGQFPLAVRVKCGSAQVANRSAREISFWRIIGHKRERGIEKRTRQREKRACLFCGSGRLPADSGQNRN